MRKLLLQRKGLVERGQLIDLWRRPGKEEQIPCLAPDVEPIKPPALESGLSCKLLDGRGAIADGLGVNPVAAVIVGIALHETRRKHRALLHCSAHLRQATLDLCPRSVGEDRLGDDEIECNPEPGTREI